ncbi:hypothetical protein SAMN03159496_05856 [Rhizobium sp. NFR07]|nr:hypothetical protein [Rhizobium sp. NFR07]SFB61604.1 hypothetical protein SAMN03159496_05856 [Rhizobium sp. NFR07]
MDDFREDYLSRLQPERNSIVRTLLTDAFLLAAAIGTGLTLNFLVA